MTKTLPPPTKPPRVSVPIDADVLVVFERLAKAANQSTGKAIAQWLKDTMDAAEFLATTVERAREAPQVVMRELQSYALGITEETEKVMRKLSEKGEADRAAAAAEGTRWRGVSAARADQASQDLKESVDRLATPWAKVGPPSCNTGGKVPPKTHKRAS